MPITPVSVNATTTTVAATTDLSFVTDGQQRLRIGVDGSSTFWQGVVVDHFHSGVVLSSSSGLLSSENGSNGQVIIGGTIPKWGSLLSSDGSIVIEAGDGTLGLRVGSQFPTSFNGNSGSAVPSSGALSVVGGSNIFTSASGNVLTVGLVGSPAVASSFTAGTTITAGTGLTVASLGAGVVQSNSSGSFSSSNGANGQLLVGGGTSPQWSSLTSSGNTISYTSTANGLNLEASGNLARSFSGNSGTAVPVSGALTVAGGSNINTSGAGSAITVNLNNSPSVSGSLTAGTSIAAGTAITAGTGLIATAGGVTATAGNISAASGNVSASGTVTAGTTVTSGTGITATTGNIVASAGNINATTGSMSAGTTIVAGTGIAATSGNIVASSGNVTASGLVSAGSSVAAGTTITAGTQVVSAVGTAAAPSYTFSGNTTTGLSVPSAGTLVLSTGGANRLQITSGGASTFSGSLTLPVLAGLVQSSSAGLLSSSNGTSGQVMIGGGSAPVWAALTAGAGIGISNGANSITLTAAGSGILPTIEVLSTSASAAINTTYITNNASRVVITLPTVAAQGSVIMIIGKGSGGWRLAQNAGQTIYFGLLQTLLGILGSVTGLNARDVVQVRCITANTEWQVVSYIGTLTII